MSDLALILILLFLPGSWAMIVGCWWAVITLTLVAIALWFAWAAVKEMVECVKESWTYIRARRAKDKDRREQLRIVRLRTAQSPEPGRSRAPIKGWLPRRLI
jgi:hypothetical protein